TWRQCCPAFFSSRSWQKKGPMSGEPALQRALGRRLHLLPAHQYFQLTALQNGK
ncbi:Hypothetical predicted protein, partial [Lynx pardinus]